MRYGIIASAVLSLGISAIVPSSAKADGWRHDYYDGHRSDDRHEVRRDRVLVEEMSIRDLPGRVLDRVDEYRHGRRIESAQRIREDDRSYYRVRIDDRDHGDFALELAPDGHLLRRVDR